MIRIQLVALSALFIFACGDDGASTNPSEPPDSGLQTDFGADVGGSTDAGRPALDGDVDSTVEPKNTTLCDVSELLFEPFCVGCHNGSIHELDLRRTGLADRLLDRRSATYPELTLIKPGDVATSFLYQKTVGMQPDNTGEQMPPGGMLPPEAIAPLENWIASGASAQCDETPAADVEFLQPEARVIRASMALRGVRPTKAELERADELASLIDEWVQTDEFGETIKDMHDEALLLRVHEGRPSVSWKAPLTREGRGQQEAYINSQIQEAPLELIEYIVRTDKPYTEILTADYTLGNETMEGVWGDGVEGLVPGQVGLLCDEAAEPDFPGWRRCRWAESDRNGAGVLSSTFFYVRWRSTTANQNRARANAITRAFLCYDFLDQPVALDETDVDLADVDAVANAVQDNPACASCHESLDPIASFLFGFQPTFRPGRVEQYPVVMYDSRDAYQPGRRLRNLREPALFGQPGVTLSDLGRLITEHPDFASCSVRRFYSYLTQTPLDAVPDERVSAWATQFVESGYDVKAIIKEMALSDAFHVSHATAEAGAEAVLGMKKVRPEQVTRMIYALTGFKWQTTITDGSRRPYGTIDLMTDARFGYRVLAGGIDGMTVIEPVHTYMGSTAAVIEGIAYEAASYLVESDFQLAANERRLFTQIELDTVDEAAVRGQLTALYWVVLGERVSADELDQAYALFEAVLRGDDLDDRARAWSLLLSALLQDFRFKPLLGGDVMKLGRRQFILGGAACATGGLLLPRIAQAQTVAGKRLIVVMIRGGWDPVVALDPKEAGPGVSIPEGQIAPVAETSIYDASATDGAVLNYFQQHGDVTAIIRGMTVASVAHEACTRRILTGTPAATSPDMAAIAAAANGSEYPLPYMIMGQSAFTGPYSAQSGRVGSSNQLVTVLDGDQRFTSELGAAQTHYPSADEYEAVRAFLRGRADRLKERRAQYGANAKRVEDYLTSMRTQARLTSYAGVLGGVGSSVEFNNQIDIAIDMLEQDVVWSVAMDPGLDWDTHTNSHEDQTASCRAFFPGLARLVEALKTRRGSGGGRLIDETVVAVVSEMGRTPMLNEDSGKDHWQITSALVIGGDVRGGRAFGKSTDTGDSEGVLKSAPVDFSTGLPSETGRHLESANFVAGILDWVGADYRPFLPNATPFRPWVIG